MRSYETRAEAVEALISVGLRQNLDARGEPGREYWWMGDDTDALLDHSATLDEISGVWYVCAYGRFRELFEERSE